MPGKSRGRVGSPTVNNKIETQVNKIQGNDYKYKVSAKGHGSRSILLQ